jgi:hypothetical protein
MQICSNSDFPRTVAAHLYLRLHPLLNGERVNYTLLWLSHGESEDGIFQFIHAARNEALSCALFAVVCVCVWYFIYAAKAICGELWLASHQVLPARVH